MKNWPPYTQIQKSIKSFPKNSLLYGTEPPLWDALEYVDCASYKGKQLAIRQALKEIGLGWVATNTTPFRKSIGSLYDAAVTIRQGLQQQGQQQETSKKRKIRPKQVVEIVERQLPEVSTIVGPLATGEVTSEQRRILYSHLNEYGACVVRKAIEIQNNMIPEEVEDETTRTSSIKKMIKLAQTVGNGVAGEPSSYYVKINVPEIEEVVWDLLLGPGGQLPNESYKNPPSIPRRKSILIKAGIGSENFAHQDNNCDKELPFQAVCLCSIPEESFQGGQFYIAQRTDYATATSILRKEVNFKFRGDLIIFQAAGMYWHGMKPVYEGTDKTKTTCSSDEYPRQTIGLLQT